jgi:hypothetical protein
MISDGCAISIRKNGLSNATRLEMATMAPVMSDRYSTPGRIRFCFMAAHQMTFARSSKRGQRTGRIDFVKPADRK